MGRDTGLTDCLQERPAVRNHKVPRWLLAWIHHIPTSFYKTGIRVTQTGRDCGVTGVQTTLLRQLLGRFRGL